MLEKWLPLGIWLLELEKGKEARRWQKAWPMKAVESEIQSILDMDYSPPENGRAYQLSGI